MQEIMEKVNQLSEENREIFIVFLALMKINPDAAKHYKEDLQQ